MGHPALGDYASTDQDVVRKHAQMLVSAGVDYILLDWSAREQIAAFKAGR